jgi:uncharacterized protein (TIGR02996 family)
VTHEEAFLEAILERPDDDAPRLIFADWLEDNGDPDRAEFIRVRIEVARRPPAPWNRAVKLIEDNWDRWVKPLTLLADDTALRHQPWLASRLRVSPSDLANKFPRGFIPTFTLRANTFLARAEPIFVLTALTRLRLDHPGDLGGELAACSGLRYIRELDFIDWSHSPLGAADMAALANSPYLGRLHTLRLPRNNLGDGGARALVRAGWIAGLASLDLTDNGLSLEGLRALTGCRRLGRLRALSLDRNGFDDEAVGLLLDAPWLDQLEFLSLRDAGVSPDEADVLLARAPRLRLSIS